MPAWIPDGYSGKGFIAAVPRLYEAVRFRYRPVPLDEGSDFLESGYSCTAGQANKKTAELLAKHLISWDLKLANGQELPITADTLMHLNRVVFGKMAAIVLGQVASDEDPEDSASEAKARRELIAKSNETGRAPADIVAEQDAKNLPAA
jgi:hypothetical protein